MNAIAGSQPALVLETEAPHGIGAGPGQCALVVLFLVALVRYIDLRAFAAPLLLLSDLSSWVTAQTLVVDGRASRKFHYDV